MKAILNNCTEGKVGAKATTLDKFLGYALGHVNIFELRDVCGVELSDFEGIKLSGYLNSEKVTHIIYFWLKKRRAYNYKLCGRL